MVYQASQPAQEACFHRHTKLIWPTIFSLLLMSLLASRTLHLPAHPDCIHPMPIWVRMEMTHYTVLTVEARLSKLGYDSSVSVTSSTLDPSSVSLLMAFYLAWGLSGLAVQLVARQHIANSSQTVCPKQLPSNTGIPLSKGVLKTVWWVTRCTLSSLRTGACILSV